MIRLITFGVILYPELLALLRPKSNCRAALQGQTFIHDGRLSGEIKQIPKPAPPRLSEGFFHKSNTLLGSSSRRSPFARKCRISGRLRLGHWEGAYPTEGTRLSGKIPSRTVRPSSLRLNRSPQAPSGARVDATKRQLIYNVVPPLRVL